MTAPPDETKRAQDSQRAPPPPARGLRPPRGVKVAAAAIRQPRILMRRLAHRERTAATEGPLRRVWRGVWGPPPPLPQRNSLLVSRPPPPPAQFFLFPLPLFLLPPAPARR